MLERVGIAQSLKRDFLLADERMIQRDVAQVIAKIDDKSLYTLGILASLVQR